MPKKCKGLLNQESQFPKSDCPKSLTNYYCYFLDDWGKSQVQKLKEDACPDSHAQDECLIRVTLC